MNLKTAKNAKDIRLSNIAVEFERRDSTITGVVIRDAAGGTLIVRQNSYGSLEVLVPSPPKLVARWQVRGQIGAAEISEEYEQEYTATARIAELGLQDAKPEKVLVEE